MSIKSFIYLFVIMSIVVLNPYTPFGPLAYYMIAVVCLLIPPTKIPAKTFLLAFLLVLISLVGVVSSILHDITQYEHLKAAVSIIVYLFFGACLFDYFYKNAVSLNDLVFVSLLVVVFNSVIIILEVLFPALRVLLESLFVSSGNVDWSDGFRYRGIASGGGASLSILCPLAIVMGLHLYMEKRISLLFLLSCSLLCIWAIFFIGRTGVFFIPLVLLLALFAFRVSLAVPMAIIFFLIVFFVFKDLLQGFLIESYGEGFYMYSFGFILDGVESIGDEGTFDAIVKFLQVVPTEFPEVIFGYGFYGGSYFSPWTDSGYPRMFLSIGYIFGALFYYIYIMISWPSIRYKKFLFGAFIFILLICEFKEPMLFVGYGSRVFLILVGYSLLELQMRKSIVTSNAYGFK